MNEIFIPGVIKPKKYVLFFMTNILIVLCNSPRKNIKNLNEVNINNTRTIKNSSTKLIDAIETKSSLYLLNKNSPQNQSVRRLDNECKDDQNCVSCVTDNPTKCLQCYTDYSAIDGKCINDNACTAGYYPTGENKCDKCSDKCKTCKISATQCSSCEDRLVYNKNNNKCETCFSLFKGCASASKYCSSGQCSRCLKSFVTSIPGECESTKKVEFPKFYFYGLGKFEKNGSKINFRVYFQIISGIMFDTKVSFSLRVTAKTERILQDKQIIVEGSGSQTGIAEGSDAVDPSEFLFG